VTLLHTQLTPQTQHDGCLDDHNTRSKVLLLLLRQRTPLLLLLLLLR
jgi:hypothetical protein